MSGPSRGTASRWFVLGGIVLTVSAVLSICIGQMGFLDPRTLLDLGSPGSDDALRIAFWHLRLPRTVLALLVGMHLALAGAIMQALFYNPLAEPYVAGVSAGAALGGVIAITTGLEAAWFGLNMVAFAAFVGATIMSLIVYQVARRAGRVSMASLLLTGIAVGGLSQAITTLLILQSDPYNVRNVLVWLMGSLAYRNWSYVWALLPYTVMGLSATWYLHRTLNVLATGEDTAHHLGLNPERAKFILLLISAMLAASAVAVSGIIGFVGLMVPHMVRMVVGANHRVLIPGCLLAGSILLLWADILARTIAPAQEMPIGVVTGVLGCLFFLYLLRGTQKKIY